MIQNLYITNSSGDTLQLNLRSSLDDHGLLIFNLTGLGSPKATASGLEGPTYDGITGYFVRADARSMQLTLAIPTKSTIEEAARNLVYEYFIVKEEITFRVVTDSKDVYILAIVESVEMNHFSKVVNAVISLYSPDPYFLDFFPIQVYSHSGVASKVVSYEGSIGTGCLIMVNYGRQSYAPFEFSNDRGDQVLSIATGPVLGTGDWLVMDSRFNQKSVYIKRYDQTTVSLMEYLDVASDWIKLYPGDNNISISYDSADAPSGDNPGLTNLRYYYVLNEMDGENSYDVKNGVWASRLSGPVGYGSGIMYPRARSFSPSDAGYLKRTSALVPDEGNFSFGIWAKPASYVTSGSRLLASITDNGVVGYTIRQMTSGIMQFVYYKDTTPYTASVTIDTPPNNWSLYTARGSGALGEISLNKNVSTQDDTTVYPSLGPSINQSDIYIGGAAGAIFDGLLGGHFYFNDFVTTAELTWLYRSGYGRTYAELSSNPEIIVDYQAKYQGV